MLESQPGKQSSRLKRSREITTEPIVEWVSNRKSPNYENTDQKIPVGSPRRLLSRYVATAVII